MTSSGYINRMPRRKKGEKCGGSCRGRVEQGENNLGKPAGRFSMRQGNPARFVAYRPYKTKVRRGKSGYLGKPLNDGLKEGLWVVSV